MATRKKNRTNVQIITDIMNYSNHGALAQMFVIDALSKHAEAVAAADPKDVDSAMINGHAWVGVAKEIVAKLNEAYGRN